MKTIVNKSATQDPSSVRLLAFNHQYVLPYVEPTMALTESAMPTAQKPTYLTA